MMCNIIYEDISKPMIMRTIIVNDRCFKVCTGMMSLYIKEGQSEREYITILQ